MQVWELGPGRLMVAGGVCDLALHHPPAVQVPVGGRGPLTVTCDGETDDVGRLIVIASGARHAVRSDSESGALTLYLGLQTPAVARPVRRRFDLQRPQSPVGDGQLHTSGNRSDRSAP